MYASHIEETTENETPRLEDYPMLQDLKDIFLDEVPGFPPKRDIDFKIELVPVAAPVSRAPYRMSTPEMLEMNI